MVRLIWSAAAVLIGLWVFFAVLRAVGAIIHLVLVVAIILVAYNLITAFRNRSTEA